MTKNIIHKVLRTMGESIRKLAEDDIKEKKREKLKNQIGQKLQELEQAEKTVEKLEERIEELENKDLKDVVLDKHESPY